MRDRALGSTIRVYFTTHQSSGVVVAPSSAFTTADFKIYKDGSATEKTTTNGITVTSPFDSQTGAHLVEIDTSNATGDSGFWASGSAYRVVISTAKTVDSKDPSGVCVGEFSLELQTADVRKAGGSAITQSGGRMEVNTTHLSGTAQTARDIGASVLLSNGTGTGQLKLASGYVAMTWADIASPTTSVNLSGTTIATTQKVDVETIKTQSLTAAAGITFGVYVGGTAAAAVASTALSTAQWTNALATNLGTTNTTVATNLDATVTSRMATYTQPTGFLAATFPSDPADQSVIIAATDAILTAVGTRLATASYTAPPSVGAIADAVWDESRTGHTTAGTFGFYLDAAISGISGGGGGGATAQEVWEYATRTLTGAVELDSAARVKLDAVQPDYAPLLASGYTAPANSDITAIKAKTDNLPSDPADQSLIIVATDAVMARLGAPAGLSMSADLAAVKLETGTTLPAQIAALNNLSSAQVVSALGSGTWATALPWNAAWDSEVQSEVQDAIEVNNLDHLLKIAVDTNFATTVHLDSVIGNIADNGTAATFVRTTDSLEAIRDNQSSGGGGGDATLAKQTEILAAVAGVTSSVASHAARLALEVQIQGFPAVICRNSDYATETESEIRLTLLDLTGTAITEIAGTPVASLAWLFGMGTEAAPAIIAGAVTWDAGTSELVIQFARSVTAAKPLGSITWQIGVSTGSGATLKNRWLGGGTTRLIERQF